MDVQALINIDVDQFYGIEIEEFPAQIAQVALWLTDHQMNMKISEEFGQYFARIPLKATPHIMCGNALQLDWQAVLPAERCSYVLGNPPFLGKSNQSAAQKTDMQLVCGDIKNAGLLDFVAAWYIKAARYIKAEPSPSGRGQGEGKATNHKLPLPADQLEFARSLRANQTDAENLMWALLRDRRMADAKFRRQHPVGKYVLDFYCHELKLAIELDGSQHLDSVHDTLRDAYLQKQGIRVLRYWNNDVLANTDAVLEDIWNNLQQNPSPQPLSQRARGIKCAFVSTNSITQGEQVGVLWGWMLAQGIKIHFAHRTFSWNNEARGKAAVHCVIVGFGLQDVAEKTIYEYEDIKGEPHAVKANNINPYLVDAPDVVLENRTKPIISIPVMIYGSKPTDGGFLLLNEQEKVNLIESEPESANWIKPFLNADEFLNNTKRYCLWLVDCQPQTLRNMPEVLKRVEAVRAMRLASIDAETKKDANTPALFQKIRQPKSNYLLVPAHTSENRFYIPFGYMSADVICGNANFTIPNATLFQFGVLTSHMHMAWSRAVCGRLESRYRYSAGIVYNNFPWPDVPSSPTLLPTGEGSKMLAQEGGKSPSPFGRGIQGEGKTQAIQAAQAVLDARATHPNASLADLYDPLTMPANLLKAHQALDKAVDAAYGYKGANTDAARVAFLFERYQQLTSLLPVADKPKKPRKLKIE